MIDRKKERKKKNRCGWVLPSKQSIMFLLPPLPSPLLNVCVGPAKNKM
jgi:hypothetical protein